MRNEVLREAYREAIVTEYELKLYLVALFDADPDISE